MPFNNIMHFSIENIVQCNDRINSRSLNNIPQLIYSYICFKVHGLSNIPLGQNFSHMQAVGINNQYSPVYHYIATDTHNIASYPVIVKFSEGS